MNASRVSWWAVCCGGAGLACAMLAAVAVIIAILPAGWVGHPFLDAVEWIHPGIDAPDNWALAFTYLARLVCGLAGAAVILLAIANPRFWIAALAGSNLPEQRKAS